MGRKLHSLPCLVAVALLAWVPATVASARTITLSWDHPDPNQVVGFEAHWGTVSRATRAYTSSVDLGKPALVGGVFTANIQVPDQTVYVAVRAYNADTVSSFSNERVRLLDDPPDPGDPPPPPPTGSPEIVGFALWDAASDTVIDSSFEDTAEIDLARDGECLAIEVLTNDYLATSRTPGSIKFGFDAAPPSSCSDQGTSHENDPPYVWESDLGFERLECAESLTQPGRHTLTVVPYADNDCRGAAGAAVTLTFDVIGTGTGGGGGGGTPEIGQPGRPTLLTQ